MKEIRSLVHPNLVAVWPGMGQVAINAGIYLISKLKMEFLLELDESKLFDVDHIEIKDGRVQTIRRPRNLFFVWEDPLRKNDLILFLGEGQPSHGKYNFCQKIINLANESQVEKVFTFAAMATQMPPHSKSRTFGVGTGTAELSNLKNLDVEILMEGNISGMNGILLGVAAELGKNGYCLLGEIPHIFGALPFPKATLAILETFTSMLDINLDLAELSEQVAEHEKEIEMALEQIHANQLSEEKESAPLHQADESFETNAVNAEEIQKIEELFQAAKGDRSKSFELKKELDRSGLFKEYEDRFLDLFKKNNQP